MDKRKNVIIKAHAKYKKRMTLLLEQLIKLWNRLNKMRKNKTNNSQKLKKQAKRAWRRKLAFLCKIKICKIKDKE
jgi:CO dehydrogenase/acetyl-CoA synthase beta subunit